MFSIHGSKSKCAFAYAIIWLVMVASFYMGLSQSAMGYSLMAFYFVLPVAGFACSAGMAYYGASLKGAIIGSLVIGFAYSAAQYLTFSLLNMLNHSFSRINPFSIEAAIGGALTALLGFGIGGIIRLIGGRYCPFFTILDNCVEKCYNISK